MMGLARLLASYVLHLLGAPVPSPFPTQAEIDRMIAEFPNGPAH
jgi:hypothetical protein